jgi:hydroxyacylglutathione hydrolase
MIRQVAIRSFDQNLSYLISNEVTKELIIVDPGDSEQLIAEIEYLQLTPKAIFLTHSHSDHLEGVFGLVERYGVSVYVHKNGIEICKKIGIEALELDELIEMAGFRIYSIYTPGHTDDSVCFYVPKLNALLTGDTLFVGSVGKVSNVDSMKKMYSSISAIRKLPPKTIFFPGHNFGKRPVSQISMERKTNNFLKARNFFVFSKLFEV